LICIDRMKGLYRIQDRAVFRSPLKYVIMII